MTNKHLLVYFELSILEIVPDPASGDFHPRYCVFPSGHRAGLLGVAPNFRGILKDGGYEGFDAGAGEGGRSKALRSWGRVNFSLIFSTIALSF